MAGDEPSATEGQIPEAIRWKVRLSDKAPQKTAVIFAAGIVAFVIGVALFRNFVLGVVGFAIIFGSTAAFWLGTIFAVDEKRASVRTGFSFSTIDWTEVKRAVFDSEGVKLSPLESAGTMDAFRGVYLRFGADNREQVERAVLAFGQLSDEHVVHGPDRGRDRGADPEGS